MKKSILVSCSTVLALDLVVGLSGCATKPQPPDQSWIEPRPLGRELPAYHPPREATTAPEQRLPPIQEPTAELTLRQSLALALARNPVLAMFSWDVRMAEARQLQAGLHPNPEAGLEVENFAGSGDFEGTQEAETTLLLSQLVLLGGKRSKAVAEARLSRDLAAWDYEAVRLDVFSRTASDFVQVLAAQQQLMLTGELVGLAEQVVQAVQERVNAARSSTVELTRAKVALDLARMDRDQAQRTLSAARQRLSANWGSSQPDFENVLGNLRDLPAVPPLEELNRRLERNPDLARWTTEIEQRRAALRLEKARAIPDVTVGAGYRRFSGPDDNAMVAGVSIPLPLFDRNQGNAREAEYRLARADEERRAAEVRVRTSLGQAWQAYDSARAILDSLQSNVLPGAQQAYQTANEYYQQGRFSFLDVLDAQRTLFAARGQEVEALRDYQQAVNEMERLLGDTLGSKMTTFEPAANPQP